MLHLASGVYNLYFLKYIHTVISVLIERIPKLKDAYMLPWLGGANFLWFSLDASFPLMDNFFYLCKQMYILHNISMILQIQLYSKLESQFGKAKPPLRLSSSSLQRVPSTQAS